jgi:SNF2 family DNA or RNA helicase
VRYQRNDCVELPPVSFSYVKVEQSKEQTRVYKLLMEKLTAAFQNGEVTAANEGVLFSKLLQIASGWVYTKDKNVVDLAPKERLKTLLSTIEEATGKVIVFADFIHTAERVAEYLAGKGVNLALVTGKTPAHARNVTFGNFQRLDSPRVLVAHPKCMAHGLTLTAANTMVWFTPTTSLETYEQACARITRPGQTQKQLIVHLTGTSVESKVYRRLREKASIQGALLDLFQETQR